MPETTVVNIKGEPCDVYCGRQRKRFHYGNPWTHISPKYGIHVATRDEAISRHRHWILGTAWQEIEPERRRWILATLASLKGLRLGCHCDPAPCHLDVYVDILEGYVPWPENAVATPP